MATPTFDPSLPAPNSPISSEVLRNQLNALKGLVEARPVKPLLMALISLDITDPPTYDQVLAVRDRVNELLMTLQS